MFAVTFAISWHLGFNYAPNLLPKLVFYDFPTFRTSIFAIPYSEFEGFANLE